MKDEKKAKANRSTVRSEVPHAAGETEPMKSQATLSDMLCRESDGLFRTLFNNLPIACFCYDREGNIQIWNKAFEELYRLNAKEIVNTSMIENLTDPSERRGREKIVEAVFCGRSFYGLEWKDRRADRSKCYLFVNTYPLRDAGGKVIMGLNACIDITERKKAEMELRQYRNNLKKMVDKRTVQLKESNEQLKREIIEHRQTEMALRKSEEQYRLLFEHSGNPITLFDRKGIVTMVNTTGARNLGGAPQEFIGKSMHELFPQRAAELLERNRLVIDSGEKKEFEDMMELPTGKRWFWSIIQPLRDTNGEIYAVQIISHDITERKKAEQALKEAEEGFRSLFENAVIGLYRTTPDGRILMANPALVRMLGYTSFEELTSRNLEEVGFEPEYPREAFKDRIERDGMVIGLESAWRRKDGVTVFIRESARIVKDKDGRPLYYEGTVEDITRRKHAEEQIKSALREKEVLLREIHHRVKNNLQIISSLLDLHTEGTVSEKISEILKKSQNRVKSLAFIHEQLYHSESVSTINVLHYVRRLTLHLFQSYGVKADDITAKIDVADILLDADTAILCGLILNELVSNSLKHAFPKGQKGEISIDFHPHGENELILSVRDNGIGFQRDIDIEKLESLGLRLVVLLVNQLKGSLEQNVFHPKSGRDSRGTEFIIRFPRSATS